MTPKQAKLLNYIVRYQERNKGASPSVADCSLAIGVRSRGATHAMLMRLQSQGLIVRRARTARNITITKTPTEGMTGMMWGCMSCMTHRIGGRQYIETKEFHTLTISSERPTCRVCHNVMTPLSFDEATPVRVNRSVAPHLNGSTPP